MGVLMFVAAFLTTHAIGSRSLWLDEGLSARIAQFGPADAVSSTYSLPTPGAIALYYILLHFWSFVSSDETWLRLLSAACVVATVPLVYLLGKRLVGRVAGVTAATVFALSPFVVQYSQQARPYGLLLLLSTALTLIFYSAMKGGGLRTWLLYAVVAAAAMYVHTTVAYLIAAHGAVAGVDMILFRRHSVATITSRLAAAAIIVVASYPLTGQFSAEGLAGVPLPTVENVGAALAGLVGGRTLLVVTGVSVLAIPLLGWYWLRRGRGLEFFILMAASIAPIALELLVSFQRPMFIERYLAISAPGLALLVGSAVDFLVTARPDWGTSPSRPSWWRPSAIAGLVAWALIVVLSMRSVGAAYTASQEQWRTAVATIAAQAEPGDGVIVYPGYTRVVFDYYADQQTVFQKVTPVFPSIGWGQYFPASGPSMETSLSGAKQTGRVWVIYRSGDPVVESDAKLLDAYLSCGKVQSDTTLLGVRVELVDFQGTTCKIGT